MRLLLISLSQKLSPRTINIREQLLNILQIEEITLNTLKRKDNTFRASNALLAALRTPPKSTNATWRQTISPFIDLLDTRNDIDAILLLDTEALLATTASRIPKIPLIYIGDIETKRAQQLHAALHLTTALLLSSDTPKHSLYQILGWSSCDTSTLPKCLPIPTTQSYNNWKEILTEAITSPSPLLPAKIELALHANTLKLLGGGSRRLCYELPGGDLCIKFYRQPKDFTQDTRPKVRKEIAKYAHSRNGNTSCQEYDYFQKEIRYKNEQIVAVFPETLSLIYLPSFGWCLIETLFHNNDGTPVQHFYEYLNAHTNDPQRYLSLMHALDDLIELLCQHAIRFFDIQNILTQIQADGSIRLRIADFEPRSRQLIPISTLLPCLIRKKIRRRYNRTLKKSVRPLDQCNIPSP